MRPYTLSQIKLHFQLLEEQLGDNKAQYLFDTAYPGYLDISVFFILAWLQGVGMHAEIFGKKEFPLMETVSPFRFLLSIRLVSCFYLLCLASGWDV